MVNAKRGVGENKSGAATHFPPNWQDRVVYGLNGIPNSETRRFLNAQARAEGGNAKWNPCNTTLWIQNFTELPNYNSIPVRNYSYPNVGVCAHILTLTTHEADGTLRYGKMVNELQHASTSGHTAEQMVQACRDEIQEWGTDPDLMLSVLREI